MENPPNYDPFDPKTWPKKNPKQNQTPVTPGNNPQNPYQQNPNQQNTNPPFPPQPNTYQQNQNPPFPPQPNANNQNPYGQLPPWQLKGNVPFNMQRELPNAGGVLALGIISIIGSFCYGVPGLGCGIPGLIMGNKAIREYEANPGMFTQSSYNNVKAGKVCAIIGICLSALLILGIIIGVLSDIDR